MNLNFSDQILVVWSLLARTLLVTSPAIIVICFSLWIERWKPVRISAWTWHFFVLAWLIIDSGLQCVTGASLWHYVEKAMVTEDLTLSGDVTAITEGVQAALWITGVRILLIFVVCHFTFRALGRSTMQHRMRAAMKTVVVFAFVAMTGIVGAREFVQQQPALEQLYSTIALRTWLFHPDRIADYGAAAFGKTCESEFTDVASKMHRLCFVPAKEAKPTHQIHDAMPQILTTLSVNNGTSRPNIVVLFTESIRFNAFCPEHTPKLSTWMQRGMVAEQHFTNSNCSELGAFASIYSQFPLCYDDTLDRQVPSGPCRQLQELGYQRQLIASCSVNFSRMNEFLGPLNFDRTSLHSPKGNPWHDNDKRTLAEIADVVMTSEQPQFVFSILMATHYSYDYPPEYDQQPPTCVPPLPANPTKVDLLRDRYFKALAFLDQQFDVFLTSVADSNTIVVITGDHGESFLDDGFLCHGTRLSDIQSRTPLLIIGPGVPAERLSFSTGHVDLMPTLLHLATGAVVPIANSHGQSLLTVTENRDQLLTMAHTNEWDVMLVGEDSRLGMKLPRHAENVDITGFFDTNGRVDLSQKKTAAEIPKWRDRLLKVIQR